MFANLFAVGPHLPEHEHSPGAGNGEIQLPDRHSPSVISQHTQSHQGVGGHVPRVRGSGRIYAEGQDPCSLDEKVLPIPQASRLLHE